jgi:integrase
VAVERPGVLGLRWEDVDLEKGTLNVRQTITRAAGALRFEAPKTRYSRRMVPLVGLALTALKKHRKRQAAVRLAAGRDWVETGLVFTTGVGTPIDPRNLSRHFYSVQKKAGLDKIRFHDMRHTCVTLLLSLGVPPHVVREIAGHSDIHVTMTIYAHASVDEKLKGLRKLGEQLG